MQNILSPSKIHLFSMTDFNKVIAESKLMELIHPKLYPHPSYKPLRYICIFTKEACKPNEFLIGRISGSAFKFPFNYQQAIHTQSLPNPSTFLHPYHDRPGPSQHSL